MKRLFLITVFFLGLIATQAQDVKWYTDVNEAIAVGKKLNKPLLLFFTGSDWCGWCIRLQKEVLKTPEFTNWAKEKVVLVELDFPRRASQSNELRMQNNGMQQAFQVTGYPTVWFATAQVKDGKPAFSGLGKTGYVAGGPANWLAGANEILKQKIN